MGLKFFEKYLSLWVALSILLGILIGKLMPAFPETISKLEYAQVNLPIAVLIWLMIYPMMVQIEFREVARAATRPKGLVTTLTVNWLIKPFTMFLFAWFFFKIVFSYLLSEAVAEEYLAGAVLLGAAPCTAMVFVWSYLAEGDSNYTLIQVAVNDLIILIAFTPIVAFLLGIGGITIPYQTLLLSVVLYVGLPLATGHLTRRHLIKTRGVEWFQNVFLRRLRPVTISALLLTLIIIFTFQGGKILSNPLHILLIAIPLSIQTYFIFLVGILIALAWKINYRVAAPAAMIGASNFFELAVAVAISLFGLDSGAALATVVGVLEEVPIMLTLVAISVRLRNRFPKP